MEVGVEGEGAEVVGGLVLSRRLVGLEGWMERFGQGQRFALGAGQGAVLGSALGFQGLECRGGLPLVDSTK